MDKGKFIFGEEIFDVTVVEIDPLIVTDVPRVTVHIDSNIEKFHLLYSEDCCKEVHFLLKEEEERTRRRFAREFKVEEKEARIESLENEIQYLKEQLTKIQDCQKPPLPPEAFFPDSPIDMASLLVNAEREGEALPIERSLGKPETVVEEKYSLEDLEEIASHIMVYVNRNRG